jgi:bisphosphoglycerate-independent phosphoglycerate mutase (AlkP superfamily)
MGAVAGDAVVAFMPFNPPLRCPLIFAAVGAVADGDAVVTFNFRADRMVEISQALEYEKFDHFDRKRRPDVGA